VRILLVSDLHYVLRQFDWVVDAAPGFDVVVLAGDHLDVASPVPLDAQSVVVGQYAALLAARTTTILSSGNHDLTGPDEAGEQSALWLPAVREHGVHTDGDTVDTDEVRITVCPWWDGEVGRQQVDAMLACDAVSRPPWWIWVYHWPPVDSPTSWTGRRHYGDADLLGWINRHRPDLVLAGHVHQPPFKPDGHWADRIGDTWVLNAGNQIGSVPARIEIDLDERRAWWVSMLGVEEQDLAEATPASRAVFG
jgi:Icc-related predicted phosphoesterase